MTTALTEELKDLEYGYHKESHDADLRRELRFTEMHRRHEQADAFERETACLRCQVAQTLLPIEPGDWFAGRIDRMLVGIDPERGGLLEAAYFCRNEWFEEQLKRSDLRADLRADMQSILHYWQGRTTYAHCREAFPERLQEGLPRDDYYVGHEISYPMFGMGGPCLDYGKLVRKGVSGLRREVRRRRERACRDGDANPAFLDCLLAALDIFAEAARRYARQARALAAESTSEEFGRRCELIERSLTRVAEKPPRTLHEAVQLMWLYSLVALPRNYGRMDTYLGDVLARELGDRTLTWEQAREMMVGLWRLMNARGDNFNNRVIIGGMGRANEETADRFALLALETQEIVGEIIPQLSLRWYRGMDPRLWEKALDVIGKGGTFPIIYNDDVNVPAAQAAFGVSREEAEQYLMYGCGEYVLDHRSVGSPDAALNVLKALDVTLHNGVDSFQHHPRGLALGSLRDFGTFEDLRDAFVRQVQHQVALLAEAQATIYRVTSRQASYPFLSLLYDDCVERGRPLLAGGVRYLGGTLESFGNNSAADSLLAIKKVVYEKKLLTAEQLLECLACDFRGHERERRMLASVGKFGNDDEEADGMAVWLNTMVCRAARSQADRVGLHTFMVVLINNGDSVLFGKTTAASADGRRAGEPLSNGNQPGAGNDRNGLTALLNSMAKLDPSQHAGAVHNVKLSRGMFTTRRAEMGALLQGYFDAGGTQVMVTVTDRRELERAMEKPQEYTNLIVRVGGYSERFVDLPRAVQLEVVKRTLY
jgi:pyruvate-formate lyase